MADTNDTQTLEQTIEQQPDLATLMSQNGIGAPVVAVDGGIPPAAATGTEMVVETPVFTFDTLKEKFGYQKPEDAYSEIESLRALKANPPSPTYEFENEESKQLFEKFTKGDRKGVLEFLSKQQRIEDLMAVEVNTNTASEIVKYGMQLRYKDLSPAEIDYKFKKQFQVPPKPAQTADEDPENYQARLDAWTERSKDAEMDLMIEAKTVRPEIEAAKVKLVLPEIDQQPDQDYLNYKKQLEENQKISAETLTAYKAFTPKSIETKLNFNDEANGIAVDFQFEPDAQSFAQAVEMTTDIDKFYDRFQNQDGTPDRAKFLKAIYNALNIEKIVTEAMKQAKNATIKSMLPDNTQGSGLIRHLVASPNATDEQSEIQKYMRAAGVIK